MGNDYCFKIIVKISYFSFIFKVKFDKNKFLQFYCVFLKKILSENFKTNFLVIWRKEKSIPSRHSRPVMKTFFHSTTKCIRLKFSSSLNNPANYVMQSTFFCVHAICKIIDFWLPNHWFFYEHIFVEHIVIIISPKFRIFVRTFPTHLAYRLDFLEILWKSYEINFLFAFD